MPKLNFTKQAIERLPLPPAGQRVVYSDTKVPGLQLRITSAGVKTFSVFRWVSASGKPERVTLGRWDDLTADQARKKAEKVNGAIAQGENPADKRRSDRAEITFGDLFTEYLERHAKPNKRTWDEDEAKFKLYLDELKGRKLSHVTRTTIAQIHSRIGKDHPVTANRVLALLSSIFGRATEWGLWDKPNPCEGIRRYRERSRERFLQPAEMPLFFRAAAAESNDIIRDYVLVSLLTGARRENVLTMGWADVDLDTREWRIPRTKNESVQTVTLAPEAVELLRNRKESASGDYIFPGKGKRKHLEEPRKGWRRILERARALGLVEALGAAQDWDGNRLVRARAQALVSPLATLTELRSDAKKLGIQYPNFADLRVHDLRRTLGSWQARTGASLVAIGRSLGHKSHAATMVYARLDTDPVRQSVETAVSAMLKAAGIKPQAEVRKLKAM